VGLSEGKAAGGKDFQRFSLNFNQRFGRFAFKLAFYHRRGALIKIQRKNYVKSKKLENLINFAIYFS